MLAVVQHQQQLPRVQVRGQGGQHWAGGLLAHLQRRRNYSAGEADTTPLALEEAATATAAMAQMLRPTYDAQTAIARAPTDSAATSIPLMATAANMDPATVTALVQTEVALAPFRPATQTAQVPTDLAATVVGIQAEDAARTATAEASTASAAQAMPGRRSRRRLGHRSREDHIFLVHRASDSSDSNPNQTRPAWSTSI
jgi:hypothetical protein